MPSFLGGVPIAIALVGIAILFPAVLWLLLALTIAFLVYLYYLDKKQEYNRFIVTRAFRGIEPSERFYIHQNRYEHKKSYFDENWHPGMRPDRKPLPKEKEWCFTPDNNHPELDFIAESDEFIYKKCPLCLQLFEIAKNTGLKEGPLEPFEKKNEWSFNGGESLRHKIKWLALAELPDIFVFKGIEFKLVARDIEDSIERIYENSRSGQMLQITRNLTNQSPKLEYFDRNGRDLPQN